MAKIKVLKSGARLVRCASCGSWVSLARSYVVNGRVFCGACVWDLKFNSSVAGGYDVAVVSVRSDSHSVEVK